MRPMLFRISVTTRITSIFHGVGFKRTVNGTERWWLENHRRYIIEIRRLSIDIDIFIRFAMYIRISKIIGAVNLRFRVTLIHYDFLGDKMTPRAIYVHVYAIWVQKIRRICSGVFEAYKRN